VQNKLGGRRGEVGGREVGGGREIFWGQRRG